GALEPLRALLAEGDPSVRAYAALGLGRALDRRSLPRLEGLLREDRSPVVQAAAAYALGQMGTAAQAPRLVLALRSGGLVSRAAAGALGRLGAREGRDSATSGALARALFDPDPELREAAASALRGGVEADSFPMPTGDALAYVTARVGVEGSGPAALAPLREALVAAAREGLHGPLERVLAALDVLTPPSADAPIALGPLTRGHLAWDEPFAAEAARELAALGEALTPDLVRASEHVEPAVRARAGALLVHFDGPATAGVRRLLTDDAEQVVRQALEGLRASHAEDPALVQAVAGLAADHPRWSVRLRAVEALGRLGRGAEVLVGVLDADPYAFVREAAARALGELGQGREALERASADPEPRVREAAAAALRR
ncbi:MAG: HEAT repeat domain-containing protein, partial [Myxococcales bacterium]|nr:HEAT repeat domain-containing protein [Myxococcales bacterium]